MIGAVNSAADRGIEDRVSKYRQSSFLARHVTCPCFSLTGAVSEPNEDAWTRLITAANRQQSLCGSRRAAASTPAHLLAVAVAGALTADVNVTVVWQVDRQAQRHNFWRGPRTVFLYMSSVAEIRNTS